MLRRMQQILHDPKWTIPLEFWYYSILKFIQDFKYQRQVKAGLARSSTTPAPASAYIAEEDYDPEEDC